MHVLDGEVHICGHDARALWPLPYPAFWKDSDNVVFDPDNFWESPKEEVEETEIPDVEEDDDEDEEEEDEDD